MSAIRENDRAIAFLKQQAKKRPQIDSFFLRGSNAYGASQVPGWSDIDATMVVKDAGAGTMRVLRSICGEFRKAFPGTQLSLTVVEAKDTPYTNPLHHHGVKPVSYNFELARHIGKKIPFTLTEDAVRLSAVYRYYEILHDFRRACVNNPRFTAQMVARGFHRLALFLRTQVEILRPDLVQETGKVQVRNHMQLLRPTSLVRSFFKRYDTVRKNWELIQKDDAQVQAQGEYLTDLFNATHQAFLPRLIRLGKGYCR